MKKIWAILLGMIGLGTSASAQTSYKNLNVAAFEQLIHADSVQIVDVRTPAEYAAGHVENAILVNVQDPQFAHNADSLLDKHKMLAVYCRSGHRSAIASAALAAKGYKVTNLQGGILAWIEEKKPVVK
ncbi:MAG: rhodanese-like domain-containing protein [Prevotella bivia]|uniref:rhodanese-like domain-containing protein n=1 Tax=Prevotella bivia TaxID=28125 RepID=UPI002889B204|nr:rhodanese-like domain-containing protein [Prevotella bivia]MBS6328293.1 rhodanese-like domain-containing protein [Prevotella bivia]